LSGLIHDLVGRIFVRWLGTDRGKIWIAADAFEPLTSDDLGSGAT